jgi:hypothetical protein
MFVDKMSSRHQNLAPHFHRFQCAPDVAGFGMMFFIVFFAFAQLGYILFGAAVTFKASHS